jgi:hypothetical protein
MLCVVLWQMSAIPKPSFKTCDETSLTLSWPEFDSGNKDIWWVLRLFLSPSFSFPAHSPLYKFRFEYKKYGEEWHSAKSVKVDKGASEVKIVDIIDLDPGTPYFVRLVLCVKDESAEESASSREEGPECVFDTKPIDCTPKKNTCIVM